jgi:hypothetical protein
MLSLLEEKDCLRSSSTAEGALLTLVRGVYLL